MTKPRSLSGVAEAIYRCDRPSSRRSAAIAPAKYISATDPKITDTVMCIVSTLTPQEVNIFDEASFRTNIADEVLAFLFPSSQGGSHGPPENRKQDSAPCKPAASASIALD